MRDLLASGRLGRPRRGRGTRARGRRAAAARARPGEDRLHRAQLRRPRGRGRDRPARTARPSSASSATRSRRPGATVPLPAASDKVDFEAEVAFVIGRRAKEVDEADALDHVAGYTLLNDLSARDLQFATPQWMAGKVFDGSAPCGPALVTADEAGPHDAIEFALALNGERMQESATVGPDLRSPGAGRPPLGADDARAGRHRLHRDTVRRRLDAGSPGLAGPGRRDRDQLAAAGRAADDDRLSFVLGAGALLGEGRREEQRQEPDDVEVEPVGGARPGRRRSPPPRAPRSGRRRGVTGPRRRPGPGPRPPAARASAGSRSPGPAPRR